MATLTTPIGRLRIEPVDGDRDDLECSPCRFEQEDQPFAVEYLVYPGDLVTGIPVCRFHKEDAIHDITPYGRNCPRCGIEHSPLWDQEDDDAPLAREKWED